MNPVAKDENLRLLGNVPSSFCLMGHSPECYEPTSATFPALNVRLLDSRENCHTWMEFEMRCAVTFLSSNWNDVAVFPSKLFRKVEY